MPARVAPRRETGIATVLTHDSDDPAAMGDQRRGHLARGAGRLSTLAATPRFTGVETVNRGLCYEE